MYKRIPKTINILILLFIILNTFSFLFLNLAWTSSLAAEPTFKIPDLQIKIPGLEKLSEVRPCPNNPSKKCVNWIGEYISGIYKYAIGIVGILATVVMMFGGVMWIVAGGNATRIGEAKAWIGAALTGLILALTSYVILYQVNPSLTQFKPIKVQEVEKPPDTGRCRVAIISNASNYECYDDLKRKDCLAKSGQWDQGQKCPTGCCAWDVHTAATALCQLTPGCFGTLYNKCDDTQKNLTEAQCNTMSGYSLKQYMQTGKCNKRTLVGTSNTFTSYECIK